MAAPRLLLFCLLLALIFSDISADLETHNQDGSSESHSETSDSVLRIKFDQLKSKILSLESSINELTREIATKDDNVKQLERVILEKSTSLASLQSEIQSLQGKKSINSKEQASAADARVNDLEKQVDNLKKEIADQNMKKDGLQGRIDDVETKIRESNIKLENLQRINDEQKIRIREAERSLRAVEEEVLRVQFEATLFSKELTEVHGAWFPPWLAIHLVHYQSFIVSQWSQHGRPALELTLQKALEKKTQVQKWAEPVIDALRTKGIPIIKEQCLVLVTNIEPLVKSISTKTVEVYHVCENAARPHFLNVQKFIDPYFQEAKKFTEPHINQISKMMGPHFDKARIFLKPYTKKVLRFYRKFIKTTMRYHSQLRATISDALKGNEFTRPLATKNMVWFMASAIMLLPVMLLLRIVLAAFSKKPKKHVRTSNMTHTRRRARRVRTREPHNEAADAIRNRS